MRHIRRIMSCELCNLNDGFSMVICKTCNIPMIVSMGHKPEFTEEEKGRITKLFPDKKIRWEMRKIKDHAHCHLEEK